MPLSDLTVRRLAHGTRTYKHYDEHGLFLPVASAPSHAKIWRMRSRVGGKEAVYTLGHYPETALAEARRRRDEKLALIRQGVDPRELERVRRREEDAAGTFEDFARRWIELTATRRGWTEQTKTTNLNRPVAYVFPRVGRLRLKDVTPGHLADVLHSIEAAGLGDTARRVRQLCVGVPSARSTARR